MAINYGMGFGGAESAPKMGRMKFGFLAPLAGMGISALGSWLGGKANDKALKNAQKNAYKASEYQPGIGMEDFGSYQPGQMDMEQIRGILSGEYNIDPAVRSALLQTIQTAQERGATDYEIQQVALQHWKKMQQEASGLEKTYLSRIGALTGVDPMTGKARQQSFDPSKDQGFEFLAPEITETTRNMDAQIRQIEADGTLDPATKTRLITEIRNRAYTEKAGARQNLVNQSYGAIGDLAAQKRQTQQGPLVGWDKDAASSAAALGGLGAQYAGINANREGLLANLESDAQRFNEGNRQWGMSRSDANQQFLEGNRLNAWATREGINSGAYQQATANAPKPGNMIASLAGTVGSQVGAGGWPRSSPGQPTGGVGYQFSPMTPPAVQNMGPTTQYRNFRP